MSSPPKFDADNNELKNLAARKDAKALSFFYFLDYLS